MKVDGPKGSKWTVRKDRSGRSRKTYGLKKNNWEINRDESRRSVEIDAEIEIRARMNLGKGYNQDLREIGF